MKISDVHFEVPPNLIAVEPISPRSHARLMVYDRKNQKVIHSTFENLTEFLKPGDLLVFNNTFVVPARFYGKRKTGGELEGLLLQDKGRGARVWIKGKAARGERITIDGFGEVEILHREGKEAELSCSRDELVQKLRHAGEIPVPPYIVAERLRRKMDAQLKKDVAEYQTVFAKESENFSVAAPTASLHFDESLMASLKQKEIETAEITLHVGKGTFAPVETENLNDHQMHSEEVLISQSVWKKIINRKREGARIIGVGTTVCRALESAIRMSEVPQRFETNLFIKPPFEFKLLDGLVTNFHWPDSTLIVLVATFLEANLGKCPEYLRHDWRKLYEMAIAHEYRLFSYGDGMLIL